VLFLLKGLILAKRALVFVILAVKMPFWLAWRYLLLPIFALVYRLCRAVNKSVFYGDWAQNKLVAVFNHRYVIHIGIIVLALTVSTTNLYASDTVPVADDTTASSTLLGRLLVGQDEELLVEEFDSDSAVYDTSYLEGTVVGPEDLIEPPDEGYDGEEEAIGRTISNAIENGPESAGSESGLPPTRTAIVEYEVQAGDTVGSIAAKYGLQTLTIISANGLGPNGIIRVGQKLRILPVNGLIVKVKKGDSISKLAKTYKSDVAGILEINGLADDQALAVGTELILPGGKTPPALAPKRTTNYAAGTLPSPVDNGGTFLWPTSSRRITQYYNWRHTGLDIGGPVGTPLFAAESGTVVFSGWNRGGYGNMVLIDHGGGYWTRYAHATKLLVSAGDIVKRGDTIALMGSTGRSTGPHLHFEVLKGSTSRRVNPLDYIK
jgi:murein DD-endopeptidase MepM/ murein hydrolase activator NlpD